MNRLLITGLFAMGCLWACSQERDSKEVLDDLADEIEALAGDGSCENAESCDSVAFGSKPCGGPWSYIIYCADEVDEEALLETVKEHAELQAKYNIENEIMSDCSVATQPEVDLVDGFCIAL